MKKYLVILVTTLGCSGLEINEELVKPKEESFEVQYSRYKKSHKNLVKNRAKILKTFNKKVKNKDILVMSKLVVNEFVKAKPVKCFNSAKREFRDENETCSKLVNMCTSYGLESSGKGFYAKVLNPEFKISIVQLDNTKKFLSYLEEYLVGFESELNPYNEALFGYCRLVRAAGVDYESSILSSRSFVHYLLSLRNKGGDEYLIEIADGYETLTSENFKNEEFLTNFKKDYELVAQELCTNSRTVRDELIYSYETSGCKVRRVTATDVDNDINSWKENSHITRADIIRHELFRDKIRACEKAHKLFNINFKPVELRTSCNKKN